MGIIDLQKKFASKIASSIGAPWDEILIHYENIEIEGSPREVFTARASIGEQKNSFRLPLEALDLLSMMKQQKTKEQIEPWTWLTFSMDKTGSYKFDFKYDSPPPLIREQFDYSK